VKRKAHISASDLSESIISVPRSGSDYFCRGAKLVHLGVWQEGAKDRFRSSALPAADSQGSLVLSHDLSRDHLQSRDHIRKDHILPEHFELQNVVIRCSGWGIRSLDVAELYASTFPPGRGTKAFGVSQHLWVSKRVRLYLSAGRAPRAGRADEGRPEVERHDCQLLTESEQARVREQMRRLLETNHFRSSRRYPALLRFIVEETLAGRSAHLKERFLELHIFGRPADSARTGGGWICAAHRARY